LDLGGVLVVGVDRDDVAVIDDLHRLHTESGLPSERLSGRQLRAVEPLLAPGVAGGALAPGDGAVDPRKVLAALRVAGTARGVVHRAGRVGQVHETDGRVRAVEYVPGPAEGIPTGAPDATAAPAADATGGPTPTTSAGASAAVPTEMIAALAVVVAAGSWSALVPGPPASTAGVRPVFGEVLRLRMRDPSLVPRRTIRAVVRGRHVYIVCRADGEIVVGATSAERGHDARVTAGGVYELLRDARSVVPALDEAEWVEAAAGFRPGTPDNAPLIGAVDPTGVVVATGHYRNGILLAPATAAVVCDLVGSAVFGWQADDVALAAVVARACDPDRFGTDTPADDGAPAGTGRGQR